MTREAKDTVATIAERTNRHLIRILHLYGELNGAGIEKKLEETAKIRFKSTSTITETMGRLQSKGLVKRKDSSYSLTDKSKAKWVVKFLNILVEEKIDEGRIIKI
jgi:Mn-dependent DtxR family transcriptional regulator